MSANITGWMLMDWDGFDLAWFDLLLDRGAGNHFAPIPISIPDQKYAPAETLINWLSGAIPSGCLTSDGMSSPKKTWRL